MGAIVAAEEEHAKWKHRGGEARWVEGAPQRKGRIEGRRRRLGRERRKEENEVRV